MEVKYVLKILDKVCSEDKFILIKFAWHDFLNKDKTDKIKELVFFILYSTAFILFMLLYTHLNVHDFKSFGVFFLLSIMLFFMIYFFFSSIRRNFFKNKSLKDYKYLTASLSLILKYIKFKQELKGTNITREQIENTITVLESSYELLKEDENVFNFKNVGAIFISLFITLPLSVFFQGMFKVESLSKNLTIKSVIEIVLLLILFLAIFVGFFLSVKIFFNILVKPASLKIREKITLLEWYKNDL